MIDFMELSDDKIKSSFLTHNTEQNIDNLVYTLTKDIECPDAYKADVKSWLTMLVLSSQ